MNQISIFVSFAFVVAILARPEPDYDEYSNDNKCDYYKLNGGIATDFGFDKTIQEEYFNYE